MPRSVKKCAERMDLDRIAAAVRTILEAVGEDPRREGLSPHADAGGHHVLRAVRRAARGPGQRAGRRVFSVKYDEMVVLRDVPFFSVCEHHLLPFTGRPTSPICRGTRSSG